MQGTTDKNIFIVMGTYNGAQYIREQIESIRRQTKYFTRLFIRDDLSRDSTITILEEMTAKDSRISILPHKNINYGLLRNYECLLNHAFQRGADYVFLSDQDDVWVPDKMEMLFNKMEEMERVQAKEVPLLVHSDLEIVDGRLNSLHPSFMKFLGFTDESNSPLKALLAQNFITGCTILVNRPLLKLALPIPPETLMHDWWLALIAAAAGSIRFVDKPLVKYRQHGSNVIGADTYWKRINTLRDLVKQKNFVPARVIQAKVLLNRISGYPEWLNDRSVKTISAYSRILSSSPMRRILENYQLGIHCQGSARNIYYYLLLVGAKRTSIERKR